MAALVLVTPPEAAVVSLDDAKKQLRQTTSAYDDVVTAIRDAAVAQFDAATGGWLGRALRPQTWELRLDEFPFGAIDLPCPPLIQVVSVQYVDPAGSLQTLDADADYRVMGGGVLAKSFLAPAYGRCWPSARCDAESVRIRFQAGYAAPQGNDPDPLPAAIKQAVHLAIRHLWSLGEQSMFLSQLQVEGVESRQWIVSDAAAKQIEDATTNLLTLYRVWT